MKSHYTIALIVLLTTSSMAGDIASSYKQAAALGDAQERERATRIYGQIDLMPYYQQKYSPVFQSCLKATVPPDTTPFSFVAAIGADGRVLRLYTDHETGVFTCARQTLQKDEFPRPPLSPYYMHVSINFSK
jgi:hypothetical protein